jgi:uncharacterized protein (TIGR03437 family)
VFWNRSATALYVVAQADSSSLLAAGTGIAQISMADARQVSVAGIVNAASQGPGRIAPGEIVTISGAGMGPSQGASFAVDATTGKINTSLAGTQVYFNGMSAPVLYASDTVVNAIVPWEVYSGGTTSLQVGYNGVISTGTTLTVAAAAPGVFTLNGAGTGQAVAVNLDGTICDAAHPAARGAYVVFYFTGGGATTPAGVSGSISGSTLRKLQQTALVTVGNEPATVTFAGAAPTFVDGVGQVNIKLADTTPTGSALPVILTVGVNSSPATATIAVK